MSRSTKLFFALIAALALGFGAGEVVVPAPIAAGSGTCDFQLCMIDPSGYQYCQATVNETNCTFETAYICTTQDCEEPCDPEQPECEGPRD